MRALALAVFFVLSFAAVAQDDAAAVRERKATLERLLRERPADPVAWFYLARFDAQSGDARGCVAALEKVDALGEGFLPARELGFEKVWDDGAFQAVRAKLEARLPRLDYAAIAFELDDPALVPEGIAYDAPTDAFFVGSVAGHRIVRIDAQRAQAEFAGAAAGLDSVLGLAADAPRRRLYAVSTNAIEAHPAARRNAILAFDLVTGRLLRRVDVPGAMQLNDVAIAPGGRVFTTDSQSGAVYEIPEKGEARVLVPAGTLRGSNGLAASPDARKLYVAQSTGLAVVDLATGGVKRVALPPRENAAAIDGLYQWQGMLVGVQNITTPGRVIAMTLAADGESVTRVRTLLSHHEAGLGEPTTGAIGRDAFYLLANTHVGSIGPDGRVASPAALTPARVLRVLLPR